MGEANISEIDHVAIGENGSIFTNGGDNFRFDCRNNVKSNGLCDVLKCCLVKFAVNGVDKVLKDKKCRKADSFSEGLDEGSMLHDNHQTHQLSEKYKFQVKRNKVNYLNSTALESIRDRFNGTKAWNNEHMHAAEALVKSSSGGIIEFPLKVLAFFAVSLIRLAGFQLNLFVGFFTFPIWLSYSSVMFFLFPLHTLRQVREYLMRKFLRMLCVSGNIVTMKAIKFGRAILWSIYVCFMLLGLLASGFLFSGILMKYLVEKPIQVTQALNFDYTKSSPIAFVPIISYPGMNDPSSLILENDVEDGKYVGARAIPYHQKLQLTVSLTLPESDYNRKLGVFQVRVEFLSANGKVIGSSSYPCMLKFKSQPIQFVETIIRSAPLIAGFQSESQIVNIKMSEFTEALEPTACLKVILERRAEYKACAGIPEIYAASLTLESELPPLKRVIWNWRRTIFVWTSFMWFLTELLIILVVCRSMIIPRGKPKTLHAKKASASNIISWHKTTLHDGNQGF